MYHRSMLALIALCLFSLTGCGASADSLIQKMIGQVNELAAAHENGESKEKIEALEASLKETTDQLEKLELPEEEEKALQKKHEDELKKAMTRLVKAKMGEAMKDLGKGLGNIPIPQ